MERYSIYDVNKPLFDDDEIIYAKNATEAVKKYMKNNNIEGSIKRDGSNYVRFKATKTKIINDKTYKTGRSIWYMHVI